jgi:hypothetical protein
MTCIHLGKRVTLLYENILPTLLSKVGKTSVEFDKDMLATIICTVVKIDRRLQKIKLDRDTPKDFAQKISKQLNYKKTIPEAYVALSFNNLDLERPHSLTEFQKAIKSEVNTNMAIDSSDLLLDSYQEEPNGIRISSKEMYKAIKALEKEIGVTHIKDKKKLKEIVKGKCRIHFESERPSYFIFPPELVSLQKLMRNPDAILTVIRSLEQSNLRRHLEFLCEVPFYLIGDQNDVHSQGFYKINDLTRKMIINDKDRADSTIPTIPRAEWESTRRIAQSLSENELKHYAKKNYELVTQNPQLAKGILLLALKCN